MACSSLAGQRDWYHRQFCLLQDTPRQRTITSVDRDACRSCSKPVLLDDTSTSSRCVMCMRFRVSAPILRVSRFCSCPCDCYNGQELDDADISDSDAMSIDEPSVLAYGDNEEGGREYHQESTDKTSRRSSTSSTWSNYSERFAVDMRETAALHYPLSFWEIHDVQMASNLSEDKLRQEFPEIEDVHRIPRRKEEPVLPTPPPCPHCRMPQLREIINALDQGMILCCPTCLHPQLGAPRTTEGEVPTHREIDSCHCRCLCEEMEDSDKTDKARPRCFLPFLPKEDHPAEWVQEFLEQRGFCLPDRCQTGYFCYYRNDFARPTHGEIISGSYEADCRQHFSDLAEEYDHFLNCSTFPNGIRRDSSTYTSLPAALEALLIRIDPIAFGDHFPHSSTQTDASPTFPSSGDDFYVTFAQSRAEPHLFTEEQHQVLHDELNRRLDRLSEDSPILFANQTMDSPSERVANLHSWILENEWRTADNVHMDSEFSLTIDPACFALDLGLYRNLGSGLRACDTHLAHHLYRQYITLTEGTNMQATSDELWEVVRAELDFRNYLTLLQGGLAVDIPTRITAILAATPETRDQLMHELHRDIAAGLETGIDERVAALRQDMRPRMRGDSPYFDNEEGNTRQRFSSQQQLLNQFAMSGAILSPPSDTLAEASDSDSHADSDSDSDNPQYDYFADPATAEERAQAQALAHTDFNATRRMIQAHHQFLRDHAGLNVTVLESTPPNSPDEAGRLGADGAGSRAGVGDDHDFIL